MIRSSRAHQRPHSPSCPRAFVVRQQPLWTPQVPRWGWLSDSMGALSYRQADRELAGRLSVGTPPETTYRVRFEWWTTRKLLLMRPFIPALYLLGRISWYALVILGPRALGPLHGTSFQSWSGMLGCCSLSHLAGSLVVARGSWRSKAHTVHMECIHMCIPHHDGSLLSHS